jgi:hypothetical protein
LKELKVDIKSEISPVSETFEFPKLESLKFASKTTQIDFTKAKNLKNLTYKAKYNRKVLEWIQGQKQLEQLEMICCKEFFDFDPIGPESVKRFKFNGLYSFNLTFAESLKLNKFIEPMCNNLTFLSLSDCRNENVDLIVSKIPKLKTLEVRFFFDDLSLLNFKPHFTLTELSITLESKVHKFVKSFCNLEVLNVLNVSISDFEWIPRNLMKLKKLSCLPEETILTRYEEMKENEENINKNIEIVLRSYNLFDLQDYSARFEAEMRQNDEMLIINVEF